jgi:uncharacterized small protein (DUF1192 family)
VDWTQVALVAVPVAGLLALGFMVRKQMRELIRRADELELTREGLKIRAERQVKEIGREAADALPEAPQQIEASEARVISMASPDQRDRLPLWQFREYLESVAALDTRAAVLEAFERIQAGLATRFGRKSFPPPGTPEAAELVQLALDSHQFRVYELMYPVYSDGAPQRGLLAQS